MPALKKRKLSFAAKVFVICAIALLYCPFFNMMLIGVGYAGDTLIQMRIGLDMIASKGLILDDIYSWHQGLNWYAHEEGWYLLVGAAYKIAGIAGVVGLSAIFNYAMAGVIFKKNLETVDPYIMLLVAAAGRFLSFPNYNARPHLCSYLMFIIFIYMMLSDKRSVLAKCAVFSVFALLMGWFHGGMVPLFFVVFLLFIFIEFVSKEYKRGGQYLLGLAAGLVMSLLNPLGIKTWTYALLQSKGEEIWRFNNEWQPKTFSVPEIVIILIVLIGFILDERLYKFDKKVIAKLCLLCMFIIISTKYGRFMNFTAMMIVMFGGEELQILLNWANDNLFKIDKKKLELHDVSYYILALFCGGFMIYTSVFSWITYFPTNTVSDISGIAAYDEGVIDVLREKKYERIYNSFNSGTWLAFYEIPVHIDNRTDLYMEEFSGEEYIRGQMLITGIDEMNEFVDKYDADALVLDLEAGTTDEWFADELYASDRYSVIYDNYVTSTYDPDYTYRWMVVECN